jgi:MFS superfamily sulfate permease-like transporter
MIFLLIVAMCIMKFVPKIPKPSKIAQKPIWVRPFAVLILIVLETPSPLLSVGSAAVLEFCLIRPLGYRTNTVGDQQRFTASDAYPRPFFWGGSDPNYDYDLSAIATWASVGTIVRQGVLLTAVGCIEGLMTADVVKGFVKTPHHEGLVVGAIGFSNVLAGMFGGIGGGAMIGLSTIACLNDGRGRITPLCSALGILITVCAAYPVLNFIPMAALAGIMVVVVLHTFKWLSVPLLFAALMPERTRRVATTGYFSWERKVVRSDVVVMLTTTLLVAFTNIVVGVGVGLAVSCAAYAWDSATELSVRYHFEPDKRTGGKIKVYEVRGPLFFGAARDFLGCFTPAADPDKVVVLLLDGRLHDYTAMDALVVLSGEYRRRGKTIEFRQLHERCAQGLPSDARTRCPGAPAAPDPPAPLFYPHPLLFQSQPDSDAPLRVGRSGCCVKRSSSRRVSNTGIAQVCAWVTSGACPACVLPLAHNTSKRLVCASTPALARPATHRVCLLAWYLPVPLQSLCPGLSLAACRSESLCAPTPDACPCPLCPSESVPEMDTVHRRTTGLAPPLWPDKPGTFVDGGEGSGGRDALTAASSSFTA